MIADTKGVNEISSHVIAIQTLINALNNDRISINDVSSILAKNYSSEELIVLMELLISYLKNHHD